MCKPGLGGRFLALSMYCSGDPMTGKVVPSAVAETATAGVAASGFGEGGIEIGSDGAVAIWGGFS